MEENKVLLILHGWGSNAARWKKVSDLLSEKNITVIVPDLPGFGQSPEPQKPWNLENYVQWLEELISKTPQLQHGFYLLGHSFGGALAAKFAIGHSQQVEKLFLVGASAIRQKTESKKAARGVAKFLKLFSFLPGYELFRKACYKFLLKSDYLYVSGIMKETYLQVISEDLSQKLYFIKVPTVIIWGDKDVFTPLEDGQFIHQKIEGSKLIVILGGEHALQIKMPDILAQKIIECLS